MLKLNFNLITPDERNEYVTSFFANNPTYKPRPHELETITNYILYGKEPITKKGEHNPDLPVEKWTNLSQRKEIIIPTKHGKKERLISLEELKAEPTLITSKLIKPTFTREENTDIPSIKELWATIDLYEALLAQDLSPELRYEYKHMIIDLRRQQYILRDIHRPPLTLHARPTISITPLSLSVFPPIPLALSPIKFVEDSPTGYDESQSYVDFTNPLHIRRAIEFYNELAADDRNLTAAENIINPALDFYISYAKLRPELLRIIELKKARYSNNYIAAAINQEFNKKYSSTYISSLYSSAIAQIVERAYLCYQYYLNRHNPAAFKICTTCQQLKLRTPLEFTRKARNKDGFSNQCKECDKHIRNTRTINKSDA